MITKNKKAASRLQKICAFLLTFLLMFQTFSGIALQASPENETQKIKAIQVIKVAFNPYFIQEVWLEPDTEYVFTYMYSDVLSSVSVALKGDNEKSFVKQSVVLEAGEYNCASMTFTTTNSSDKEATMGTGANAGKIKAYVGIRNYTSNTAALNTYYTGFTLYKKSDANKTNIIRDTEFTSLGAMANGAVWNGFYKNTNVQINYGRVDVDKELFKNQNPTIKAIKVINTTYQPYFIQEVWLEPDTEYVFTYMYSDVLAGTTVALKGDNEKSFVKGNVMVEEGEYNLATTTFTTTNSSDKEATMGTGANAGKIKAYVGIRNYNSNSAVLNTYFTRFTLYKKSDANKTNIIRDTEFTSLGAMANGAVWNGFYKSTNVQLSYGRADVDENIFKKQNSPIKVSSAVGQSYIGQWVELQDGATYYTSYYFSPTIDANHVRIDKDATWDNNFAVQSITYDKKYLKATAKFTVKRDELTDAYAKSVGYTGDGVLAYVSFKVGTLDNGYIYDWRLYKEGEENKNLFKDEKISRLGAEKDGGCWYSNDRKAPNARFSLSSLDAIGGMDAFLIPDDLAQEGGQYALKSEGKQSYLLLQEVSLESGKNYKFSYYYNGSNESACTMVTSPTHTEGSIKDNIISIEKDDDYYKQTFEFTAPKAGEYNAIADPEKEGNVLIYVGVRMVVGKVQYYYDFRLYESDKTEDDNILLDNNFKYLGYKWKQRYYELFPVGSRVKLTSLKGGLEFFERMDYSTLVGDGTDYVIKVSGKYTPFMLQKVSLTPGVTYSFSFYHSNVISKGECYTGSAFIQVRPNVNLSSDYIESIVNEREWKKTTTTFVCPEIGMAEAEEDPKNPGKVIMYVGIRYYGDDQYEVDEKPLYFYNFRLYETDSKEQTNILIDNDYQYFGETWFQHYFETIPHFSRVKLSSLEGGFEWFKKITGPDIDVPLGDKMMTYGSDDGVGYLYIDLPYTVKKNHTNGKYYILSINIRPTEGREPLGFVISTYSGGTTAISPISVEGYTYKFFVQERYNFRLGIQIASKTSGYISGLQLYEADIYQNIIGKENVATAFGKNGTFADWDVQPGIRWLEISGASTGLYPGELPIDYKGRTCGTLVAIPKDYFVLPDPGEWWSADDVVAEGADDVGTVSGKVKDSSGTAVNAASLNLISMSGEQSLFATSNNNGEFVFKNVPVGGYDLYIIEDDGTQVLYNSVWLEQKGDKVELSLTYSGNGINVQEEEQISGGVVCGSIVDTKGEPIKGLTVALEDGSTVETDENGYFEFASLEEGVHSVYIQNKNGSLKIADIMVKEGIAYQLTSADGSAIMYDPAGGTVQKQPATQERLEKNDDDSSSNTGIIIAVCIGVAVLIGLAAFAVVFVKKKRR